MGLANWLTIVRILLVPVFVTSLVYNRPVLALVTFVVAGVTDMMDGYIARTRGTKTRLGAFLDPLADKLLLTVSFVTITYKFSKILPFWLTAIVLSRDLLLILVAVLIMLTGGQIHPAPTSLGKVSTVFQMLTVGAALLDARRRRRPRALAGAAEPGGGDGRAHGGVRGPVPRAGAALRRLGRTLMPKRVPETGVRVLAVEPGGLAAGAGLRPGDRLLRVNGQPLRDLVDFHVQAGEEELAIEVDRSGRPCSVVLERKWGRDLGLECEPPAPAEISTCANKCVFCFIHQLPKGLRKSLYVKDDDYRLSFLHGNYITLTDLPESEIQRIIDLHLTPLYVSVHATDPALRYLLLGSPKTIKGDLMERLRRLAESGIRLHTQIVLCPGLNDGPHLERTVRELGELHPGVHTVAVVPVGLTRHREGLYPLRSITPAEAGATLDAIHAWQADFRARLGTRLVFAADELYLQAGRQVPPASAYEEFSVVEDGVGPGAPVRGRVSTAGRPSGPPALAPLARGDGRDRGAVRADPGPPAPEAPRTRSPHRDRGGAERVLRAGHHRGWAHDGAGRGALPLRAFAGRRRLRPARGAHRDEGGLPRRRGARRPGARPGDPDRRPRGDRARIRRRPAGPGPPGRVRRGPPCGSPWSPWWDARTSGSRPSSIA